MHDFLTTATDRNGKRSVQRTTATSAANAVAQLEEAGCTQIELHSDDAFAISSGFSQSEPDLATPEELVALRSMTTARYFLFLLKKQVVGLSILLVPAALYVGWTLFRQHPPGLLLWCSVGMLSVPVFFAFYLTFFTYSRKFDLLLAAWSWGQWQEVTALAARLRGHVPDFELDAREAVAIAKLGRIDDGLDLIERHADSEEIPEWMYWGRLAEFHECLEQHHQAIECHRLAYEVAPDVPTVELDYAICLLKNDENLQEAERLIASAEAKPLSDILQMLLPFVHGLRDLRNGKHGTAIQHFLEAQNRLSPLASSQPLIRLIIDFISAWLTIAAVGSGNTELAAEHYPQARRRLQAIGAEKQLAELNHAAETLSAISLSSSFR